MNWRIQLRDNDHDHDHRQVVHLVLHADDPLQHFLNSFLHKISQLTEKVDVIMATLDDVVAKVTDLGTVEDGVVALLTDIKGRLDAAGNDPAKLQALSDALDAQKQKLADAVVANTPAA